MSTRPAIESMSMSLECEYKKYNQENMEKNARLEIYHHVENSENRR